MPTMTFNISSADLNSFSTRTEYVLEPMSIVPAGVLRFSYANVDDIDSTVIPYAANLSGSTKT